MHQGNYNGDHIVVQSPRAYGMRKELRRLAALFGARAYYAVRTLEGGYDFIKSLGRPFQKTIIDSREIYQQYDDREQRDWETRFETVLDRGRITVLPFKEVRRRYVDYLCQELQAPGR